MSTKVIIDYTNHRGERTKREIKPKHFYFGTTQWHMEPGWLLEAWDYSKEEFRTFSMKDIHSWEPS